MSFIFSTSSYAFGFGLEHSQVLQFGELYENLGVRFINHTSVLALKKDLEKVRFLVGIHHSQSESLFAIELERWKFAFENSHLSVSERIQRQIDRLKPAGLAQLSQKAFERILPNFFKGSIPKIGECLVSDQKDFDLLIQCDSSAWPFVGRCLLYVRFDRLMHFLQTNDTDVQSRKSVVDLLKEVVNQFLGVINQSLTELNYSCRVGLPLVFTQTESKALSSTGLFIPFVRIGDEDNIFDLNFGFVNSTAGDMLDLSHTELSTTMGEVDYL